MLVQIALLGESQMAVQLVLERADKWSLLCVDSQVVVEVMPLAEVHWTAGIVTF